MSAFDLTPFCDPEAGRYNLEAPWVANGWKIATDGRVCVRCPTDEPDTDDGKRRPYVGEKPGGLFTDFPTRFPNAWPRHDGTLEKQTCRTCNGYREIGCSCPDCTNEHVRKCPNCCDGTQALPKRLEIAGRLIDGEYCLTIQALGDVKYATQGNPGEPLSFVCGELQGKIMPLVREGEGEE